MASLKKRAGIWYARFRRTRNGYTQEAMISLATRSKEVAMHKLVAFQAKISAGKLDPFDQRGATEPEHEGPQIREA